MFVNSGARDRACLAFSQGDEGGTVLNSIKRKLLSKGKDPCEDVARHCRESCAVSALAPPLALTDY